MPAPDQPPDWPTYLCWRCTWVGDRALAVRHALALPHHTVTRSCDTWHRPITITDKERAHADV